MRCFDVADTDVLTQRWSGSAAGECADALLIVIDILPSPWYATLAHLDANQ